MSLAKVLAEVVEERRKQDEIFNEQNHPYGTGPDIEIPFSIGLYANDYRDFVIARCYDHFQDGIGTWLDILLEEVAEAFAEENPRNELIQVAAVAIAWIEAIDRRNSGSSPTATGSASENQSLVE